jgi:uncharacterized protein YciI
MTQTWLYRLRLNRIELLTEGPTPDEATALEGHWNHLVRLRDEGRVIFVGRSDETDPERLFGDVVFTAPDEASARAVMESDPAVFAGVQSATLYPMKVFMVDAAALPPEEE